MRKIIEGKVYDTEKAKKVAEWENMSDVHDLYYVCETLYRKRNGEYFIHGEGGAATNYSQRVGSSSWCSGESVMPMEYEHARQWMEDHTNVEDYEREFGVVEDDSEVVLSVRVSAAAKARLDQAAAKTGKSRGEILTMLLLEL